MKMAGKWRRSTPKLTRLPGSQVWWDSSPMWALTLSLGTENLVWSELDELEWTRVNCAILLGMGPYVLMALYGSMGPLNGLVCWGKSEPETIDFPIISMGLSCKFSLNPIHWSSWNDFLSDFWWFEYFGDDQLWVAIHFRRFCFMIFPRGHECGDEWIHSNIFCTLEFSAKAPGTDARPTF